MLKAWMKLSFLFVLVMALSGCMYPEENLSQNQVPYKVQIQSVQTAVNQFKKDNGGILPIKTRDQKTPIYQKYPIDFQRLAPKYLPEPPGNAYESGGIFEYVLIDAETNPTVKLLDLRVAEKIRDLKLHLQSLKYPPFKGEVANNVYTLDYKKIGYKEDPYVASPYTNNNLPFVMNGKGEIFVDYRNDLNAILQKQKSISYKPGDDIRPLLIKNSDIVPAYSLPYTVNEKNEPVFMTK